METPLSRSGEKGAPESNPRPLEPSPPRPLSLGDWFLISLLSVGLGIIGSEISSLLSPYIGGLQGPGAVQPGTAEIRVGAQPGEELTAPPGDQPPLNNAILVGAVLLVMGVFMWAAISADFFPPKF